VQLWPLILLMCLMGILLIWRHGLSIKVEKLNVPVAGLPEEFSGFKIAHLSDLHGRRMAPEGLVAEIIRASGADIVVITGDFVTHDAKEVEEFLPLLAALSSITPVYAVSGNHDYKAGWEKIAKSLAGAGVTVLDDAHVALTRQSARLFLVGVRDPFSGRGDLAKAMPEDAPNEVCVLLAHSPSYFEAFAKAGRFTAEQTLLRRVALTLCGHTHGGQIKLPLVGAVTNGSRRLFPRDYVEGLSWQGAGWLYISRGIGWVILPLRLLSRPEVAIITLLSHRDGAFET